MGQPINQFSFSGGELAPQLWDRVDIDRYHSGAALMSNFFVDYRGGASNRPGTAYCLQCLDATQPSRLIPFSFSTLQTYALQFGLGTTYTGTVLSSARDTGGTGQTVIAVASTAGLMNGNRITISGTVTAHIGSYITGTIDGNYAIQIVDSTHIMLLGSVFIYPIVGTGSYTIRTGVMRVFTSGAAVLNPPVSVTAVTNASPGVVTYADIITTTTTSVDPVPGDWVYLSAMAGMNRLQDRFAVVTNLNTGAKTFQLYDLFGAPIDTTLYGTYTSGGLAGTVYNLAVPYDPQDLAELKFTQSADVMTLTHTLYQQAQLTRTADNAWTYTPLSFAPSTPTVTGVTVTNNGVGTQYTGTYYNYQVTATVSNVEGEPGTVASGPCAAMSENVGAQNKVAWTAVTGATTYSIYRTQENLSSGVQTGAAYGYVGSATGTSFVDENITPDFARSPPIGNNPFTGIDWPGCTTYFQGRQAYAGTENEPDRLVLSKSGDYTNMDFSNPTQPGDVIDVTLESTQVNAIQHLVSLQVLLALTSSGYWRIDTGDTTEAMTPSNVMARPQSTDGCSNVPPIVIDYEILFVQNKQSTVRAIKFDFLLNLFKADNELTLFANHLVFGHRIVEWAWAQQPFRLIWAVRDDGVLLSLTYLPTQNLMAWARHETNGRVLSICTVVEGTEDAIYMVVQRQVNGQFVNYVERMASRIFTDVSQAWFVDAGVQYPQVYPAAAATPSAMEGNSTLASAANVVFGGSNYSGSTVAEVVDAGATYANPGGSGSTVSLTIVGGVITAAAVTAGSGWIQPQIVVTDPTGAGSGAVLTPIVQQLITVNASAAVFNSGTDVGKVLRINGGVGTVTAVGSTSQVTLNVVQALTSPYVAPAGEWTLTTPVTTVSGLDHLTGCTVAILADGSVQPQQVVQNGSITLTQPADAITVGLPYTAEIDSLYIDVPTQEQPTSQGKRKKISRVTLRVANSRGLEAGPLGQTLYEVKDRTVSTPMGQPQPMFEGDYAINLDPNFNEQGQIAMVQANPLPASILGFMPELTMGDV